MKKLTIALLSLLMFLPFVPIHVKATGATITASAETISLLSNGIDYLSFTSSVPYGFLPLLLLNSETDKNYQNVMSNIIDVDKADIYSVDSDDVTIRRLSSSEKQEVENYNFFDDFGNSVPVDNIMFGLFDNGYFTGYLYCDTSGNPLYLDNGKQNAYSAVAFGGSQYSALQWELSYDELADSLSANGYNYSLTGANINGDLSFYRSYGETSSGRPARAFSMFIPNQYQPGIIVPYITRSDRYIANWYCNDLSVYDYRILYGNESRLTVTQGNYSYNGYTYKYNVSMGQGATSFTPNNTFEQWSKGINVYDTAFGCSGIWLNNSLLNSDVVSFKKVDANADSIDFSKSYSIDDLSDYYDVVSTVSPYPYSGFNSNSAITDLNYPLVYSIDTSVVDNVISYPDSAVGVYDPVIDYPLDETIDPSLISNNIPIISDLQNKFPFSIPWDIYNLVQGLSVPRETPVLNYSIVFPVINYTWDISIDLSMYNDTAVLFRSLFLILFVIGLAIFSYNHFFGS